MSITGAINRSCSATGPTLKREEGFRLFPVCLSSVKCLSAPCSSINGEVNHGYKPKRNLRREIWIHICFPLLKDYHPTSKMMRYSIVLTGKERGTRFFVVLDLSLVPLKSIFWPWINSRSYT